VVGSLTLNHRKVVYCSGGEDNSGAILDDGSMFMWGSGARGKLGIGSISKISISVPQMVQFQNKVQVIQCSLGPEHTGCVTKDGSVYMWGSGYYGTLGLGHTSNVYVPEKVSTFFPSFFSFFLYINFFPIYCNFLNKKTRLIR
jgi:alpha-tubulin suppressor-like RCC1 family protein